MRLTCIRCIDPTLDRWCPGCVNAQTHIHTRCIIRTFGLIPIIRHRSTGLFWPLASAWSVIVCMNMEHTDLRNWTSTTCNTLCFSDSTAHFDEAFSQMFTLGSTNITCFLRIKLDDFTYSLNCLESTRWSLTLETSCAIKRQQLKDGTLNTKLEKS